MTQKLTKIVVNCTTGEQFIEELTDQELEQLAIDQAEMAQQEALREGREAAQALARASARSKLAALGLTEDELAALL